MKTITFFNEKGGVGKSSTAIMYASWLKYNHGVNVAIADFNNRITEYRLLEFKTLEKETGETKTEYMEKHPETWPIVTCLSKEIRRIKEYETTLPYAKWLAEKIKKGVFGNAEVIICDFPGSFENGFRDCITMQYINYVAIPYIKERTTFITTNKTVKMLTAMEIPYSIFLNKANMILPTHIKRYENHIEQIKKEMDFNLLPDAVLYSEKMDIMDKIDAVRSTLFWPDFTREEYGKTSDMGLENLFIDITRELKKQPDLTRLSKSHADLSFVEGLKKNGNGRQLVNNAFPEYYNK